MADKSLTDYLTEFGDLFKGSSGIGIASAVATLAALSAKPQVSTQANTGSSTANSTLSGTTGKTGTSASTGTTASTGGSSNTGTTASTGGSASTGTSTAHGTSSSTTDTTSTGSKTGTTDVAGTSLTQTKNPQWYDDAIKALASQVTGDNTANPLSTYTGKLTTDAPAAWDTAQSLLSQGGAAVTPEQIQASMNPFTEQILAPQLAKLREQYDIQGRDLEGSAAKLNAFGGDRYALEKDLINRRKDSAVNELTASSMKTSYDEAMKLTQDNRTAALQAGGAYTTLGSGQLSEAQANAKAAYDEYVRMQQGDMNWLNTQGSVLGGLHVGQTTEGATTQQGTNTEQAQNSSAANTFGVTDSTGTSTNTGTNFSNGTTANTGTNFSNGTTAATGTTADTGTMSQTGTQNGTNTSNQTLTGPDPNTLGAISNVLVAGVNMANAPKTLIPGVV